MKGRALLVVRDIDRMLIKMDHKEIGCQVLIGFSC
jgi:hypothetical protein